MYVCVYKINSKRQKELSGFSRLSDMVYTTGQPTVKAFDGTNFKRSSDH